jgi:hypothetical protein
MSDQTTSPRPPRDDGELLAAYLACDLDDVEVASVEARLAAEPALRARLDATAEVLFALRAPDAVEPPDGYAERLVMALDAARAEDPEAAPSLEAARRRRARRGGAWVAWSGIAATVLAAAVLGGIGLTGGFGGQASEDMVALDAADDADDSTFAAEQAAPDSGERSTALGAPPEPAAGDTMDEPTEEHFGMGGPDDLELARPSAPVILDQQEVLVDEAAVVDRYAHGDEVSPRGYLGEPLEFARDLAAAFHVALQRAGPFASSGDRPAACLDVPTVATDVPVVPVRVETVVYGDTPGIAYVVLTASQGADVLDRAEVWIVDPATCAIRLFRQLTPS